MKPILEIKGVSKKFNIHANTQPYLSLRENLFSFVNRKSKKEDFWALKDVSFTVETGDTVGIIGKNGAGKSTLLKILSKITPPTSGSIIGRGRIASLLEVGTGFHPELSGKENIFMNGSILGMRRSEIMKNFDAIVDFSGVEKFINTPLKHYSSGMQLRLAFAVAAFLENEILVIDEVLAVGDSEFQKKCMRKMGDVSKSGRTILFVSHNMSAIAQLCSSAVFLINGQVQQIGRSKDVIGNYINHNSGNDHSTFTPQNRIGRGNLIVTDLVLNNYELLSGKEMSLRFKLSKKVKINTVSLDFRVDNHFGEKCFWVSDKLCEQTDNDTVSDTIIFKIPRLNLNLGLYHIVYCLFVNNEVEDMVENCLSFEVFESDFYQNWKFPPKEQANVLVDFTTHYE